jgi:iron(III) transport system permease protein
VKHSVKALALLLFLLLAAYVGYPLLMMFVSSLQVHGSLSIDRYIGLLNPSNPANLEAAGNSVLVSLLSVAASAMVGSFLAVALTQLDFKGKGLLARLSILPIGLPPLVGVIAFLLAFGDSGVVPRLIQRMAGEGSRVSGLSGVWGILVVHTYSFSVYYYLMVSAAIRKFDGAQIEAATTLGGGGWHVFRRILLPGMRPALLGASVLTFMASMASFTAPLMFAGDRRFLTLQIYFTKLNGDLDLASAQSVLLGGVSILFFVLARVVAGEQSGRGATKGTSRPARLPISPLFRRVGIILSYFLIALSMLPFLVIVMLSFAREGSWTWQLLPQEYTFQNYISFATDPRVYEPLINSLWMACVTMVVAGGVGLGLAWWSFRSSPGPGRRIKEVAFSSPYALPGTVVGIALVQAFGVPTPQTAGNVLVGTVWILPLAYLIRTYPLVLQPSAAALEATDPTLQEASLSLGASRWRTFWRVIFPAVRPAVISGVLLAGIMAVGEFVASVLLYSSTTRPVSVEIFSQLRMFNIGSAAAYSVLLLVVVLGMIALDPERKT